MEYIILSVFLLFIVAAWLLYGKFGAGRLTVSGSVLARYSRDLTALAHLNKLDPVIGREKEIARVIQILSRRTKNNPVLIGNAGVGKTAIVEGLAEAIDKKKVPPPLYGKRVLALDLSGILAGTKYRGEFEQRLKQITNEIVNAQRSIILFIDEIHTLAEAGEAEGAIDADDILKPLLARGELQVVGATTHEEYDKYIRRDKTLDRRLQPILVAEPTTKQTRAILEGIRSVYEDYHQVKISDQAIEEAIKATDRIINRSYPDKAIDALDEACSKVRIDTVVGGRSKKAVVTEKDVESVVEQWREAL